VRFGLGLSVQHLPEDPQAVRFREHVEQVRLARAVGFSSVWASQHYLSDPFTYFQPIPTLARLAADARGMILGTGVLLLPLLHPVDVAEQLATLDVIADGRLVFGVGLGYRDVENLAFGHDPKQRVGRFEESLEVVERLWRGEPVDYEGRYFTLRGARISMRPMQSPRPPVWLAANGDAGVRRAARLGDAWLMNPHADPGDARAPAGAVQSDAARGRPTGRHRDAADQGMLRRAGQRDGDRRVGGLHRAEVRRLPALGAGQGAAGGRELRRRLRRARARPLHHR
jgi:alkanesulfonate monooxygenase SsuD/methylene tetrahydromethanopterin reductase-like flavin-dependent oxidoreductase (luciferase family)